MKSVADELWRAGELWNTFISAGRADVFWTLARRYMSDVAERLERYAWSIDSAGEAAALITAYEGMAASNFSRSVLAHTEQLAVLPVVGSGWSDWGSPQRVLASLDGTESYGRLVALMSQVSAVPSASPDPAYAAST